MVKEKPAPSSDRVFRIPSTTNQEGISFNDEVREVEVMSIEERVNPLARSRVEVTLKDREEEGAVLVKGSRTPPDTVEKATQLPLITGDRRGSVVDTPNRVCSALPVK